MDEQTSCIFHNNGGEVASFGSKGFLYFDQITKALFNDHAPLPVSTTSDLDIVICHNYPDKEITERTLDHLGYDDYHVLGSGIAPWHNILKISLVLDFIKQSRATYIMHLDGSDVAVCTDPRVALERFRAIPNCEMLCNAETASFPNSATFVHKHPEVAAKLEAIEEFETSHYDTKFAHLNSGCYIARRESLIEFLELGWQIRNDIAPTAFNRDDQRVFRELHRRFYPRIQMDATCRIFQCLQGVTKADVLTTYPVSDSFPSRLRQSPLLLEKAYVISVSVVRRFWRSARRRLASVLDGFRRRFPKQYALLRRLKRRIKQ